MADASASQSLKGRFGTFGGVFVPNVLTILGLIYFLRTGWVVGQVGMVSALIIVAIANVISLLTGLSLSAVATNLRVKGGGDYYLISRTLGRERLPGRAAYLRHTRWADVLATLDRA